MKKQPNHERRDRIDRCLLFFSNFLLLVAAASMIVGWQPFMLGYWNQVAVYGGLALVSVGGALYIKHNFTRPAGRSLSALALQYASHRPAGAAKFSRLYYLHKLFQSLAITVISGAVVWFMYSFYQSTRAGF